MASYLWPLCNLWFSSSDSSDFLTADFTDEHRSRKTRIQIAHSCGMAVHRDKGRVRLEDARVRLEDTRSCLEDAGSCLEDGEGSR
jgi:hypothetical protein